LDGSFEEFIGKMLVLPVEFDKTQVKLTTLRGDQLHFGWEGQFMLNGEPLLINGFKHYDNPYCTCGLGASLMDIQHGSNVLRLHFEET
jgi:hypothetical protein